MGTMTNLVDKVTKNQINDIHTRFKSGDIVKVHIKIKEGEKRERIQIFEGLVIKVQNGGINTTFTVLKTSYGINVQKTFPLNSPIIVKIEILSKGKVRRNKLNYMKERKGKKARIKQIDSSQKPNLVKNSD